MKIKINIKATAIIVEKTRLNFIPLRIIIISTIIVIIINKNDDFSLNCCNFIQ